MCYHGNHLLCKIGSDIYRMGQANGWTIGRIDVSSKLVANNAVKLMDATTLRMAPQNESFLP